MTTIFISHAQEDSPCADHIRQGLDAHGYSTWREPGYPGPTDNSYPRMIENAILKSAAIILIWSNHAAQSLWIERHMHFAQQLKKSPLPVVTDGTALPNTLVSVSPITSQAPCTDAVAQLLSHLPAPNSTDPLIKLCEQAAHEFIRDRKEAIEHAAAMLQRGEQREAVLAVLEYLAHNDLMTGVRENAQAVLDTDAQKVTTPPLRPDELRHIFGVRCKKGHVTDFDKRRVCVAYIEVPRKCITDAGEELDELHLKCKECGEAVVQRVDCRGYK